MLQCVAAECIVVFLLPTVLFVYGIRWYMAVLAFS